MIEPRRLLEDGGSDLEVALLRSARDDVPSPRSRQKTLLALGLAGSVGATVTTATATSTATTAALKSASTLALLKWIGAGVIGGVLTLGAMTVVAPSPSPTPPVAVASKGLTPVPTAALPPAVAPLVVETAAPEPPPSASSENPSSEKPAPTAPAPIPAPAKPAPTSLTEEVAALDAAREALAAGDAARTLRALDEHDRRFPGGMLGPEATVLRIEALALRGERARASKLGAAFLQAHPRSPHAARLRTLLGLPSPAQSAPAP